jgi:hypothetical protein
MLLVASPRVGVVVYPRVTGELIRAAETFRASRKGAGMGLLASMCPDMAGLVLETVKGLLTQRALVRAREVLTSIILCGLGVLEERSHKAHGGSGHGRIGGGGRLLLGGLRLAIVIEDAGEVKTALRG